MSGTAHLQRNRGKPAGHRRAATVNATVGPLREQVVSPALVGASHKRRAPNVHLNAEKGRRWLGALATIAAVVVALELIGLVSRPAAWAIAGATLVVVLALLAATSRK